MQVSIVKVSNLDDIVFRLDAEFYHPTHLYVESKISKHKTTSIREDGGALDCSAFYPSIVPSYNFEGEGVPFLRVNEIQDGLIFLSENTAFLPPNILSENKNTIAKCSAGDLIIAKGGNSLAKVALLTGEHDLYSVCRDVIVLRTQKLSKLNIYYVWMFLHSDLGRQVLLRTASQTGQPHLTLEAINQLQIPVLNRSFQASFEKMYFLSQEKRTQSEVLSAKAQDIVLTELGLNSWQPKHQLSFVKNYSDVENFERIDAEYFQPKYDDIINAIKSYQGGWDRLGDLVTTTKSVEVGSGAYLENGVPFVRVSNLNEFEISEEKFIADELYNELAIHQPQKGEILLSKDGSPGIAHYLKDQPEQMIVSGGILRLQKHSKKVNHEYLTLVLNSLTTQEQVKRDVGGSIILHWRPDQVENTLIPILEESKQLEIQQKVSEAFKLRKQSKQILENAKRAVEMAIEQDEATAMNWLNEVEQQKD